MDVQSDIEKVSRFKTMIIDCLGMLKALHSVHEINKKTTPMDFIQAQGNETEDTKLLFGIWKNLPVHNLRELLKSSIIGNLNILVQAEKDYADRLMHLKLSERDERKKVVEVVSLLTETLSEIMKNETFQLHVADSFR